MILALLRLLISIHFRLVGQGGSVPVHDSQEPEGPEATITRTFACASGDIFFCAEALDLRPLGDVESHRVEAAVHKSYSDDIESIRSVPQSLPVDPRRHLEGGSDFPSRNVFAGCTEDESDQRCASDDR